MRKMLLRKAMVCALAFAMVSVVFSTVPMVVRSTDPVLLRPGYISGKMTIQGETIDEGLVHVFDEDYVRSGFDPHPEDGDYLVVVEGNKDYHVAPVAQINVEQSRYLAQSNISIPMKDVSVDGYYDENEEWVPDYVDLDFDMVPGYIDATVTVPDGFNIDLIVWRAHCRPDIVWRTVVYSSQKREEGLMDDGTQYYLDGHTVLPIMPWGIDNNDDQVIDHLDEKHIRMSVTARVDGVVFDLPYKYFGTTSGDTTYVSWDLDLSKGSVEGYVDVSDDDVNTVDDPYTYRLNGAATIAGSDISKGGDLLDPRYPWNTPTSYQEYWDLDSDDTYSKVLFSGDWDLFPEIHFYDPNDDLDSYLSLRGDPKAVTISEGTTKTVNWDIEPCFVEGTVTTNGVDPALDWIIVNADLPQTASTYDDAWTITHTNDYRLILYPEDWFVGAYNVQLFYDHDLSYQARAYGTSSIRITDFGIRAEDPVTLEAGDTVEDVDFSYDIAMITLKYLIEGGGSMGLESISGYQHNVEGMSGRNYWFGGQGIPGETAVGECTCVMPAGLNHIEARAYVDGSHALFGEFDIDVDVGDVIVSDIGAPIVDITTPTGYQHISSSEVVVSGTATDDTGVSTITVNGQSVSFQSTGSTEDPNEVAFSTTVSGLTYGENTITVVATDSDGMSGSMKRTVVRDNSVPVADAGGPYLGYEGSAILLDGSGSADPQGDDLTYRWDFDNDGTWDTDFSVTSSTSHTWYDDCTATVKLEVSDGVNAVTDTAEVTVSNVAPAIDTFSVTPSEPVKLGESVKVLASYIDPGSETLATTICWGDESSSPATGDSVSVLHEYTATGVYTITLSVTDGDATASATYQYVVVYDPDGGFVTGGGWITSPEGAYVADETLSGRANFGFVSKYKKGADVPTGNVEFQFRVGGLNFHSSDFDWLVVAGSKAMFKGTGTINGEGTFGFMISAVDGDDDTFRIKIWDKDNDDAVVYDNQLGDDDDEDPTTVLGGGNIVVHKAT